MEGLVVALYGPWGSGKSSLKNMILEMIRKHGDDPTIVEFNPWAWSGRDRIFGAFFEEVGIAIGKGSDKEQAKALATRWRKYGARLSFAGIAANALKMGTQAVGIPVVPLLLEGVATGAKKVSELSEGAAKAHEAASQDEPLEESKKALAKSLAELKAPMLVVMDDVDRLSKDEIRTLFQLIKANADFPRMVYLLLFERAIIEKALDGEGGSSGREYLEKIVQAGFDLPKHDQADLDRMLCEGLNRLLSLEGANRTFEAERWGKLHLLALRPILQTPRDVNRFLSSFSFTVGLFFRERTLEVNVIDMIGIEVLRVFEPDLYHQLPEQRDLLLGSGHSHRSGREDGESRKQRVEKFIEQASEPHRTGIRAILRELFPSIDWLLMGYGEGSGFEANWMRSLRICHKDLFARYFALAVPKGDLPVSMINRLLSVIKDVGQIRRELTSLSDQGRLVDFLNRLAAYASEIDMAGAVPFMTALMDVGDSLPLRGPGMYDVWPDMAAYFVIRSIMTREVNAETRSRMVLEALSATKGLYLPLQVVSLDRHRRERGEPFQPSLLDEPSRERAKKLCLGKIKARAADGTLRGPKLGSYIGRWRELAGDDGPRKFIKSLVATQEGVLEFLRASAGEVRGQAWGNVTFQVQTKIDLGTIEKFMPLAKIKSKLGPLLGDDVPENLSWLVAEYQKELAAFRDALDPARRRDSDHFVDTDEATLLNLNTATIEDLSGLPGIDRELASRIIERRPFGRVDDLREVSGIGVKKFARICNLVVT